MAGDVKLPRFSFIRLSGVERIDMKVTRMILVLAVMLTSVIAVSAAQRPAPAIAEVGPALTCADLNAPEFDGPGWGDWAGNVTLVPGDTITIIATPIQTLNSISKSFANVYARAVAPLLVLRINAGVVASANWPTPGMVTYTEASGISGADLEWYISNESYADWDVSCASGIVAGCDMYIPLTADAVVGAFVADANTYWTPGQLTAPLVTIESGKTAWVLGVDVTGQYYKIVWACQYLWVQVPTMGPDFDKVWNGTPLPTSIVH
jgi:hypothetical protein